jgi:hypothetical protein
MPDTFSCRRRPSFAGFISDFNSDNEVNQESHSWGKPNYWTLGSSAATLQKMSNHSEAESADSPTQKIHCND